MSKPEMQLHDHFRPPLSLRRHWHAFHNAWATYLSSALNRQLPARFFAEANVQFGIEIEATAEPGWIASSPTQTVPISVMTDVVEVQIYHGEAGPTLAGAIELVSPANKDRPAHREAFVSKCAAYLQEGVGLILVDVVTDRKANLHDDLLERLRAAAQVPLNADLYIAAYHSVMRGEQPTLDIWQESLAVGGSLPVVALWLRRGPCLRVDFAETYDRTCREQRVIADGA